MATSSSPREPVREWWKRERSALRLYLLIASTVVGGIVMRQTSAMLSRVEVGGYSNGMSVLTRWHLRPDALREAGSAWSADGPNQVAAALISRHAWVDMVFVVLYVVLLRRLLVRLGTENWAWGALACVLAADVVENVLTLVFAGIIAGGQSPGDGITWALFCVTWVKWLALAGVLVGAARAAFHLAEDLSEARVVAVPDTRLSQRAAHVMAFCAEHAGDGGRVWRRHRVQIGVLFVLGVLVAVPVGGPLDQVPDILRTYADGRGVRVAELVWSFVTLGLLCLALWVAGRWALLDAVAQKEPPSRKRWPTAKWWWLALAAGLSLGPAVGLYKSDGELHFNESVFALPVVLAGFSGLSVLFGRKVPPPAADTVNVPDDAQRERIRRTGRFLAALPVAIAGLGLTRAFVDSLLGYGPAATAESRWYLALGILAVLVAAPVLYAVFSLAERRLLRDSGQAEAVRTGRVNLLGVLVLVVAGVLAGLAAWQPVTVGPLLNATGSVSVFLALVAVVGGAVQVLAERQCPYAPTRHLLFRERSPFFVVFLSVFLVAGLLNTTGGYHAMRVLTAEGRSPSPLHLESTFGDWLAEATKGCSVTGELAPDGVPAVPLVLAAAPGGGIRAAFWTDRALHALQQEPDCDGRLIFAASGVSGGSVGLVAHYLHADEEPEHDPVTALSEEGPLAASVAAMLFRDLPAAVLGVSAGWADRAAVVEDAWAEVDGDWSSTTLLRDLQPGHDGADGWRPLLLLNGTEVSTGCRLLVSPVPVVASTPAGAPQSCRSTVVSPDGHGFVEGAVDLQWFRDQQACDEDSVQDGDLRASTAALLSARFPYVSPSAELFRCTDEPGKAVRAADLDGGAAENSGLATVLDLWDVLEPTVANHNDSVQDCHAAATSDGERLACERAVVPMLLLIDNHYTSSAAPGQASRQRELSAPVGLRNAKAVLAEQSVLEQEALVSFSGHLPGFRDGPELHRFFRMAPVNRPGLAAPLGWTLSEATRVDLQTQLTDVMAKRCRLSQDPDGDEDPRTRGPALPSCYLDAVGGPLPATSP